ncbi:MAG: hypothetical protein AB1333_01260 [Patescibacteria group bacterium]
MASCEACIIEIKSENEEIDKTVRWYPRRHLVLISEQIMIEKYRGRIYTRPFLLKEIGEFKEMKRVKVTEKFAYAMIDAFTKNELIQMHADEFDKVVGIE